MWVIKNVHPSERAGGRAESWSKANQPLMQKTASDVPNDKLSDVPSDVLNVLSRLE